MIKENERTPDDFIDEPLIDQLLTTAESAAKDADYVRSIIEKAKAYQGLTAAEVAVLLKVTDQEILAELFAAAAQVKKDYLRQPYRLVRTALSVQPLCQQLYLLWLSHRK